MTEKNKPTIVARLLGEMGQQPGLANAWLSGN
jgi:hypothetical protein